MRGFRWFHHGSTLAKLHRNHIAWNKMVRGCRCSCIMDANDPTYSITIHAYPRIYSIRFNPILATRAPILICWWWVGSFEFGKWCVSISPNLQLIQVTPVGIEEHRWTTLAWQGDGFTNKNGWKHRPELDGKWWKPWGRNLPKSAKATAKSSEANWAFSQTFSLAQWQNWSFPTTNSSCSQIFTDVHRCSTSNSSKLQGIKMPSVWTKITVAVGQNLVALPWKHPITSNNKLYSWKNNGSSSPIHMVMMEMDESWWIVMNPSWIREHSPEIWIALALNHWTNLQHHLICWPPALPVSATHRGLRPSALEVGEFVKVGNGRDKVLA